MDWANEKYVRVYTRDTTTWKLLPWQAKAILPLIFRKVDRSGLLDLGADGLPGLAALLEMPVELVEAGMPDLLRREIVVIEGGTLVVLNFIEAQETPSTPASRQRDSRERRRDMIRRGLAPEQRGSVVYFLQSEDGGPIKIGRSDDVAKRILQMQMARPDKLVLLAAVPGEYADETRIHRAFAAERVYGEWFAASPGLVQLAGIAARDNAIPCDLSRFVTSHADAVGCDMSQNVTSHSDTARCDQSRNVTSHSVLDYAVPRSPRVGSGSGSDPLSVQDPDPERARSKLPANEPGKPTARHVLNRFAAIRGEVCATNVLFYQPTEAAEQKGAAWLSEMPRDAVPDIEPAIRLACEHVKRGDEGWTGQKMADANFLWGTVLARWTALREELHGCTPRSPPQRGDRATERQKLIDSWGNA